MSFRTGATDCHVGALPLLAMTETESPRILSLRGAERRGNLGKALTFSPELPCYPALYCEIVTSAFGLLAMTNLWRLPF